MRRIVSIILAAALFCLTLTACGSRQKTDLSGAKTIADLKGATIAAQAGTFHLDAVDQIEGVEKKSYPDFTDLLNALKSGAIDGYVAEEPTALEVCGKDDTLTYLPFVNNDTGFTATAADVGIAMGGVGSDIAVDAADIALVDDEVKELPHLVALSRRMMTTIKLNMTFSMTLNFIAIALAIIGTLDPVVGGVIAAVCAVLLFV